MRRKGVAILIKDGLLTCLIKRKEINMGLIEVKLKVLIKKGVLGSSFSAVSEGKVGLQ